MNSKRQKYSTSVFSLRNCFETLGSGFSCTVEQSYYRKCLENVLSSEALTEYMRRKLLFFHSANVL
jgi:hypothetical protein